MRRECLERAHRFRGLSDPDMHHGTCVTHAPWCMPGSLTIGFLWRRWRGNRSRNSRRMRNPQFYVSGERPVYEWTLVQVMAWCQAAGHYHIITKTSPPLTIYGDRSITIDDDRWEDIDGWRSIYEPFICYDRWSTRLWSSHRFISNYMNPGYFTLAATDLKP